MSEDDKKYRQLTDDELRVILEEHLKWIRSDGADGKRANLIKADLSGANLIKAYLHGAYLSGANLHGANLGEADLSGANLIKADLGGANLNRANLSGAYLSGAYLSGANLHGANLSGANLNRADLGEADLSEANLGWANLSGANLNRADLSGANLHGANLGEADLSGANLNRADLSGANLIKAYLSGANLNAASLIGTDLSDATLNGGHVYGVNAWDLKLEGTKQLNLVITPFNEPAVTVDNLEVAQFIYLLLENPKIRDVIDTITSNVVLILGRFSEDRKRVLDSIREDLRRRNLTPVLFDFEKPARKDVTGTVETLARMARFIVADLTDPSSIPFELGTVVPFLRTTPVLSLRLKGSGGFGMFDDLRAYPWVLETHEYEDGESLIGSMDHVLAHVEEKVRELRGEGDAVNT